MIFLYENNNINPYGLSQILKYSYEIYRNNFQHICWISLCVFTPFLIIRQLIPSYANFSETSDVLQPFINSADLQWLSFSVFTAMMFEPLAIAAITYITLSHFTKKEVTLPGILDASLMKWGKLLATAIVYFTALLLPFMTFILAWISIYLMIAIAFYANVVAVTDKWGIAALLFSRNLVRGKWLSTLWKLGIINSTFFLLDMLISTSIAVMFENAILYVILYAITRIFFSYFYVANAVIFVNYFTMSQKAEEETKYL